MHRLVVNRSQCDVCAVDDEEEPKAADEEEQAETVNLLPTPFQPALSLYLNYCITHYPYQSWCPVSKGAVVIFGTAPM